MPLLAKVWLLRIAAILVLLGAWVVYATMGSASSILLPDVSSTVSELFRLLRSSELWQNALVTLVETAIAFALACTASVALAVLAARSRYWSDVVEPVLGWGYMIPQVVFFPLFILWFGIDNVSKVVFAAVGAFFPLALAAVRGVRSVDPRYVRVARAFGANQRQIDWTVRWRAALPLFISGLRVGAALSLILVILGEMLAATEGLGFMLTRSTQFYRSAESFALLIIIVAVGAIVYAFISRLNVDEARRSAKRRR
jgi:ABC-type nitrate/sulfonate/bicarbonate transport system permease component